MNKHGSYQHILRALASDYFNYLSSIFPVMCASDEFHFMPRAKSAAGYYDQLDSLGPEEIKSCISTLKLFQTRFASLDPDEDDLEGRIDLEMLRNSIAGALLELETKASWSNNPLLYLKIAFIGLDHALGKPASGWDEVAHRTLARLDALSRLLKQASKNLQKVSITHGQASLLMIKDCREYLYLIKQTIPEALCTSFLPAIARAKEALEVFQRFVQTLPAVPDDHFAAPSLEDTLRNHFGCATELREILEIGRSEWEEAMIRLRSLQARIDPRKNWLRIYEEYYPEDAAGLDTFSLYARESERLRTFFRDHWFRTVEPGLPPEVAQTPAYLRSVRASASFSAAFSDDVREKSFFYITTQIEDSLGKKAQNILRGRLHREYRFLTAHETFPGHHLLDDNRRKIPNPVRSQIECPLFYEGWAYYAESLLTGYGYIHDPLDELVDARRSLWRAARCWIDVGTNTGELSAQDAVDLLMKTGYSRKEAGRHLARFRLNPGYQLCYTLGRHEIMKLKKLYETRMGQDRFHREMLTAGQLPFHLMEKRLQGLLPKNSNKVKR